MGPLAGPSSSLLASWSDEVRHLRQSPTTEWMSGEQRTPSRLPAAMTAKDELTEEETLISTHATSAESPEPCKSPSGPWITSPRYANTRWIPTPMGLRSRNPIDVQRPLNLQRTFRGSETPELSAQSPPEHVNIANSTLLAIFVVSATILALLRSLRSALARN